MKCDKLILLFILSLNLIGCNNIDKITNLQSEKYIDDNYSIQEVVEKEEYIDCDEVVINYNFISDTSKENQHIDSSQSRKKYLEINSSHIDNFLHIQGDWLYYESDNDIFKIKKDGQAEDRITILEDYQYSSKVKMCDKCGNLKYADNMHLLCVIGDWIYVTSGLENGYKGSKSNFNPEIKQHIYRIRTDGEVVELLFCSEDGENKEYLAIRDNMLYYRLTERTNKSASEVIDKHTIQKLDLETFEVSKVVDITDYLNEYNDWRECELIGNSLCIKLNQESFNSGFSKIRRPLLVIDLEDEGKVDLYDWSLQYHRRGYDGDTSFYKYVDFQILQVNEDDFILQPSEMSDMKRYGKEGMNKWYRIPKEVLLDNEDDLAVYLYDKNYTKYDFSSLDEYLIEFTENIQSYYASIYYNNGYFYSDSEGLAYYSFEDDSVTRINKDRATCFTIIDDYLYYTAEFTDESVSGSFVYFNRIKLDGTGWEDVRWIYRN